MSKDVPRCLNGDPVPLVIMARRFWEFLYRYVCLCVCCELNLLEAISCGRFIPQAVSGTVEHIIV